MLAGDTLEAIGVDLLGIQHMNKNVLHQCTCGCDPVTDKSSLFVSLKAKVH